MRIAVFIFLILSSGFCFCQNKIPLRVYYDTDSTVSVIQYPYATPKIYKILHAPIDSNNCNHIFVKVAQEAKEPFMYIKIDIMAGDDDWDGYNIIRPEECVCILCHKKSKCF